jgi:hypothetical protein
MIFDFSKFILIGVLMAFPCFSQAGEFFSQEHSTLGKVHSAYLARDFRKMAVAMKDALMAQPDDPQVKENVLRLYKKAYEVQGQNGVPADWQLPDEITKMRITVRRIQKDLPEFSLKVSGNTIQAKIIKQLQVIHYPDQIVLDKRSAIGEWKEGPGKNSVDFEYQFQGRKSRQQVATGLYLLKVELTNGKSVDGWFLVDDDMNASTTPEVSSPAVGETFTTGNPKFIWVDFRSPEYKPYEHRSVWIGVSRAEPPNYDWDKKWQLWVDSPTLQQTTVGPTSGGTGVSKLENGRYVFVINYGERRRFGDVMIGRDCMTNRTFIVQQ